MYTLGAIAIVILAVSCCAEENWLFYVGIAFLAATGLLWLGELLTPVCATLSGAAHVKACG